MKKKTLENINDINQDLSTDISIRPYNFDDFIGQRDVVARMRIYLESVRIQNGILDHILLSGPPGLGKTSIAYIISHEIKGKFHSVQAPVLEKTGDLAAHLTSLERGDIFFIDEIHRLRRNLEELLYAAMEDFKLDIVIGQGAGAQTLCIDLPKFTLIGATTRPGMLTSPLLSRFGIQERLDFYQADDLSRIAKRTAKIKNWELDAEAAIILGNRCRGTPRLLNSLLNRVYDFAVVENAKKMDSTLTLRALNALNIDEKGLNQGDREFLRVLIDKYNGGPVGLDTLAASLSEEVDNLTDIYEPYLLRQGLIARTPRGRVATKDAYIYLGRPLPYQNPKQIELF